MVDDGGYAGVGIRTNYVFGGFQCASLGITHSVVPPSLSRQTSRHLSGLPKIRLCHRRAQLAAKNIFITYRNADIGKWYRQRRIKHARR